MLKNLKKIGSLLFLFQLLVMHSAAFAALTSYKKLKGDTILLADPTVFADKGIYYLYGTGSKDGFLVYQSADLKNWSGPVGKRSGHALMRGDSYGTKGFWAPQVFKYRHKYYMAYTADEHIAIAESDSPLGPFKQKEIKCISGPGKQIDPYVFVDTDGALYMFHVRLQQGNRIFVARLNADLADIDESTAKECLHAEQPWENTDNAPWPVSEGPTVLKHNKLYYLFYSANDFRNINYAVGYATAASPLGPWKKTEDSPIISRKNIGVNGTGHGDFFTDASGQLYYVLHTHNSNSKVGNRKTGIVKASFTEGNPAKIKVDPKSFRYLQLN
ncbi:glycoside hydrolase family 43 protein [Mucilaginibacter litoreus]|uniref:Glycoside hydrolase family 43 protein n=1 Tax=Mucilaginibacter litoreus TaxID=1048221 RepID=A0ABW3APD6_9SPHI